MKVGNLCQQQEGFRESWEKERNGRVVTEDKLGNFFSSPRGRLWVTLEENRDKAMSGVREDLCHTGWCPALDWPWGKYPGEFLPGTQGAEGPWGLTLFLHSAGACLGSKRKQEDKKQKHQQERGLTAKLCRNQMSFFRAFLLSPGKLGLLHLYLGVREHLPPRKKPGLGQVLALVSVGFLVMGLCNHSHEYSSDVQHNPRLTGGFFEAGEASWGHRSSLLGTGVLAHQFSNAIALHQVNLG